MLRMFARAHSGQVQTLRPFSTAGDQDSGGGTEGVGCRQVEQFGERNGSVMTPG